MSHHRGKRGEEGQTSAEFLGMLVVVAMLIAGLVVAPFGASIEAGIKAVICRIIGGSCSVDPADAIDHTPEQCTTLSSSRNVNASITVFSVKLDGGVTLTLNRSVQRDGSVVWTVDEVHDGGLGLAVQTPGGGVSVNGKGAELEASGSVSLTGAGGNTYRFATEEAARAFMTTATHQIAKDAVASGNPLTSWGPGRDAAMWVMDQVDGRSYDPPAPQETWVEGGVKTDGSADIAAGIAGGGVEGGTVDVVGGRVNHEAGTTTVYYRTSREAAGHLGLVAVADGTVGGDSEVVVGVEMDNQTHRPVSASITASGTLSGGLSAPLAAEGATLSAILDDAAVTSTGGKHGTAEVKVDLTQGDNLRVFSDAVRSVGLPVLDQYASTERVSPVDGVRGLYDLFDTGAPGTYLGVVTYDQDDSGFDASASGGAGVRFAGGFGFGTTGQDVDGAWYYDPAQGGMVPWLQCSM